MKVSSSQRVFPLVQTQQSCECQTMGAGCEIPQKWNFLDVRSSCGSLSSQRFSPQIYCGGSRRKQLRRALETRAFHRKSVKLGISPRLKPVLL